MIGITSAVHGLQQCPRRVIRNTNRKSGLAKATNGQMDQVPMDTNRQAAHSKLATMPSKTKNAKNSTRIAPHFAVSVAAVALLLGGGCAHAPAIPSTTDRHTAASICAEVPIDVPLDQAVGAVLQTRGVILPPKNVLHS